MLVERHGKVRSRITAIILAPAVALLLAAGLAATSGAVTSGAVTSGAVTSGAVTSGAVAHASPGSFGDKPVRTIGRASTVATLTRASTKTTTALTIAPAASVTTQVTASPPLVRPALAAPTANPNMRSITEPTPTTVAPGPPRRAVTTVARPSFAGPSYYPVGADAVVVADFTGDGRADVAVAAPALFTSDTVALLVQTPTGALAEPQRFTAHTGSSAVVSAVAADINGDGLTDLLVGSSNGIDFFEQHAGGLLPPRLLAGLQAYQIIVADINFDGIPDLVVDTDGTSGLRTMLGVGGGQFGPPDTVSTDAWPYHQFQIGDVTGDGIGDIVGHNVISVEVRPGHRDGTFGPPADYPIPWPNDGGQGLALGDFNGDGRVDAAATNSSNNPGSAVHVFYQTPAGTFGPATTLPSLDLADMTKAVDVNGDGRLDLVVAHGGWDYAGVYLQQPDNTFTTEQLYYMGRQYFDASSGLDVGDINRDGLPDIVVGSAGGLVVLRQTPIVGPTTSLVAQASAPIPMGGAISDRATLAGGVNATGTIIFALFGPANPTCSGAPVLTSTTPVTGNGDYTSASFIPTAAGTYHFVASYSGDATNPPTLPTMCGELSQAVVVSPNAMFTIPHDGQTNVDTTMPFTWTPVAAAQGYYLVVGTGQYGSDLVNSGVLPVNQSSLFVADLPAGNTLYATLFTNLNGTWTSYQAITFTAATGHGTFTYPLDGQSTIDTFKPFTWKSVTGAQAYLLVVGTTVNGTDLVHSVLLSPAQLSLPMPDLPVGRTLYATLLTEVAGTWRYQAITFTVGVDQAAFTNPLNGLAKIDTTKPFTWNRVSAAQAYVLAVGTTLHGTDLINSGVLPPSQSSLAMPDLPAGRTLYATLLTDVAGTWRYQAITFTAAVGHATFTNPVNGQTNVNNAQPFTWATIPAAQGYLLVVGTTIYGTDLTQSAALPALQRSYTVTALPKGRILYATLFTEINGSYSRYQVVGFIVS
jgi:hypothetical protein